MSDSPVSRPSLDLGDAPRAEVLEWLASTGLNAADVLTFVRHGVRRTETVESHIPAVRVVRELPEAALLADDEVADFVVVGASAWVGDPENRDEWAQVGRMVAEHDARLTAARHRKRGRGPSEYPAHEAVKDLFNAGRSPSYARALLKMAERHSAELDAFGFSEDVTPSVYDDLMTAGIRGRDGLRAYAAAGLSLAEAVGFAVDLIPPAAVLMAKFAGVDRSQWKETLTGIPATWFRVAGVDAWGDDAGDPAKWTVFLDPPRPEGDEFTLAQLRSLADSGWTADQRLAPYQFRDSMGPVANHALRLAANGLNWADLDRWKKALLTGKAPRSKSDASVGALLGVFKAEHISQVIEMHTAGIRPSHLTTYRKAGCRSIANVLVARHEGITADRAKQLLDLHGRKPSKWHATTVFDSFTELLRHHAATPS